jgi:hypothetical protein
MMVVEVTLLTASSPRRGSGVVVAVGPVVLVAAAARIT